MAGYQIELISFAVGVYILAVLGIGVVAVRVKLEVYIVCAGFGRSQGAVLCLAVDLYLAFDQADVGINIERFTVTRGADRNSVLLAVIECGDLTLI